MSKREDPVVVEHAEADGAGGEDVIVTIMPPGQDSGVDTTAHPRLARGSIINDKYVVEEVLGRGGMGIVLSARHVTLAERYAIKVLFVDTTVPGSDGGDFKRRFLQEARVSASLRGEHVARVFDVGALDEELLFMVMERVEGPSLARLLKTRGTLPMRTAVEYVTQMCEGLAEAHARGIVHRDIKPMNVHLTTRADGSELIKILDFGIAKLHDEAEKTKTGMLVGSVSQMAPEQLRSSSSVDERADVWSLGVLLHQLLTGKPPLTGSMTTIVKKLLSDEPMPKLRDGGGDFPIALEAAITHALTQDVDTRTQTVADFARDILTAADFEDAEVRADLIAVALGGKKRRDPGDHAAPGIRFEDRSESGVATKPATKKRVGKVALVLFLLGGVAWVLWPTPHEGSTAAPRTEPSASTPALASGVASEIASATPEVVAVQAYAAPAGSSRATNPPSVKPSDRPRRPMIARPPPVVAPVPAKPSEAPPRRKPANPYEERQ